MKHPNVDDEAAECGVLELAERRRQDETIHKLVNHLLKKNQYYAYHKLKSC